MELDARLALLWYCSLAAWQLFPGKQQGRLHMYLCRKLHANSSHLKSRSTVVILFSLAALLDWSEREVKFQFIRLSWPCGYCAMESMVIGGKNESSYSCLAVELCSHFVFSLALQNLVWMWSLIIDSMLQAALAQRSAPTWDCSIECQSRTAPKCIALEAATVFISRKQRGLFSALQLLILFPSQWEEGNLLVSRTRALRID